MTPDVTAPMAECWRIVGVGGDRSCPELTTFIHCRNCPVLAEAARQFFDRAAPAGYLDSWRTILEEPTETVEGAAVSALVFRLANEWLALPAGVLVEVTPLRPLHRIPHRVGAGLAGLVNIRGQLQLAMSLHRLVGLEGGPQLPPRGDSRSADDSIATTPARLLVMERDGASPHDCWVVGVDEIAGVHRVQRAALRAVPSTVGQVASSCASALFEWQGRTVALLDEARVFEGLRGMLAG